MSLSQRLGITPVRTALQGRDLDTPTRIRLWNAFAQTVPKNFSRALTATWMYAVYIQIWINFLRQPVDDLPPFEETIRDEIKHLFLDSEWYRVYDLLEFVIKLEQNSNRDRLRSEVITILHEELAGFRWLDDLFVEITDETEIEAIERAISVSATDKFVPVRAHLATALALLSDRRTPDYRNSIKESISAVEAVVQILTGEPQAELGKALKLLHPRAPIHGALRASLMSLYGYTSDADGIRHALTDEPNLDAADAKFMLVTCSAFVVYLIQKANGIA